MEFAAAQLDQRSNHLYSIPVEADTAERVSEYVTLHAHIEPTPTEMEMQQQHDTTFLLKQENSSVEVKREDAQRMQPYNYSEPHQQQKKNPQPTNIDTATDLARFLAKSHLITEGLCKYDDKPENFLSWKSTFKNTIAELGLSALEEINLLVKWLGPESSQQAQRIKAVSIHKPTVGLTMIWSRLEECYGSPEAIERALFGKLENFPKLSNKEYHKLRELGDLLLEVETAKLDGYLPGLNYLDTAKGVCLIVEKLPFNLQEKWTAVGPKF